jgi:hypothetical protein
LADDRNSLFRAANAHSRLHQAAVVACSSITVTLNRKLQTDSLLLYLQHHGKQLGSMHLTALLSREPLRHLPPTLQLTSLIFSNMRLQLQPGGGFQGVLRPGLPLKQLRLQECIVLDGADDDERLTAAWGVLSLLTELEVLSISCWFEGSAPFFTTAVLAQLQQLTCLELDVKGELQGPNETMPALQPLQSLTKLPALKVVCYEPCSVTASVLSQLSQLTRLELADPDVLEPAALAGKTQLQHLGLAVCDPRALSGRAAELLSQLQHLTQLTYLGLRADLTGIGEEEGNSSAAAFSALTASSKRQHLNFSECKLPANVWQHIFIIGRQLPHLQSLVIDSIELQQGGLCGCA